MFRKLKTLFRTLFRQKEETNKSAGDVMIENVFLAIDTENEGDDEFDELSKDNPLMLPIHGISLKEYAAITYYLSVGADQEKVLSDNKLSKIVWKEIKTLWNKRIEEDGSLLLTEFYSRYFNKEEERANTTISK